MEYPLVDGEILHNGEGGDVEQWLEPQNKLLVFAIGFLFTLYCFAFLTCVIICLLFIFALISFTCIFGLFSSQQESNCATQLIILRNQRGEVLEPFTGNSTSISYFE